MLSDTLLRGEDFRSVDMLTMAEEVSLSGLLVVVWRVAYVTRHLAVRCQHSQSYSALLHMELLQV